MTPPLFVRTLVLALVGLLVAGACTATETVIVSDATIARATATAESDSTTRSQPAPSTQTGDSAAVPGADEDSDSDSVDLNEADEPRLARGTGEPGCSYLGVDSFDDMQLELVFTSPLDTQTDANVAYTVVDGSGEIIVESDHFIEDLLPGETLRLRADTFTDLPIGDDVGQITCSIGAVEADPFGFETFRPQPGDACVFLEIDSFGDIQIQLDVVSPLDVVAELAVDYALRGPDGIRFSQGVAYIPDVPAGGSSSTPEDTFTALPDWVNESEFSCDILSVQAF